MTAATVEADLATTLGLEHPSAINLATILDTEPIEARRAIAGRAAADRLTDLGLYRTLLVERYGSARPLEELIRNDGLYADLVLLTIA